MYVILSLMPAGDSACKHHFSVQQYFFSRHSTVHTCTCVHASACGNRILKCSSLHCNSVGPRSSTTQVG